MSETEMVAVPPQQLSGQPPGLRIAAATIFGEALGRYGIQALLTLYMVGQLMQPGRIDGIGGLAPIRRAVEALTGPLSNQALAVQIVGLAIGFGYFTPLIGGWLGDRLGRRPLATVGALLLAGGAFLLALDATFLLGLLLQVLGAGALTTNVQAQLSGLYAADDRRREDGFQFYYLALNIGAFLAPVVCGWVATRIDWRLAFIVSGLGMLGGLAVYWLGSASLPDQRTHHVEGPAPPLTAKDRQAVALLLVMVMMSACFWIAQSQVWNVYNLWVNDRVSLRLGGFLVPVPWLQGLDSLAPAIMLPAVLALWRAQARHGREPDAVTKMAIGCGIFGASMVWLAVAPWLFGAQVPLAWAMVFHFIDNLGWLYFTPIALALYGRAAPARLQGLLLGVNAASVFVGTTVSGRLGGLYGVWDDSQFWLLHGGIAGGGAAAFLMLRPVVRRVLDQG